MNYTMITNHAHTRMNPPPLPPRGTRIQKIGFIAPMLKFPSAKISKTRNMLCKHGTTKCHNKLKMKWYKY